MYYNLYLLLSFLGFWWRFWVTIGLLTFSIYLIVKFISPENTRAFRFGFKAFTILGIFYAIFDFIFSIKNTRYLSGYPMLLPEICYAILITILIFYFCNGKPLQTLIVLVSTYLIGYAIACFTILFFSNLLLIVIIVMILFFIF